MTAYGTTTKRYVSYELDGRVYKTKEFAAIGDTVAMADSNRCLPDMMYPTGPQRWRTQRKSGTITDGSFVMPDGDVVLKATTTPKYQVTVNVDGQPVYR